MLLAYGLLDKSQIQYLDKSEYHCGEDGEWILHLTEQIEEHWKEEQAFHEKQHEEFRCAVKEEREAKREIEY